MKNKLKDPIAIEKKQNVCTTDYKKLNAFYEDVIPQKEFSAEQKYFLSTFISSESSSNESLPSSPSKTKPTMAPMPSPNPMKLDLNKMENDFKMFFSLLQTNSKRESIFYTSPEEIRLTKFYQQEVKPILHKLHLNFEIFQKQFLRDIKEMKDVFNSTQSDISATCKQNKLLNDQLLEAKLKHEIEYCVLLRLKAASSVRRPSNRDSPFKNSMLSNTKNSSEKVEVSVRTNKKTYVASKNVVSNKKIVTDADVKNALKAKDVLCVSCAKHVLISCHDKCLENYKLSVHSKVRRSLFTTPRIVKFKFADTTLVVLKTRFSVKTTQSKSLDTTPIVSKTKIVAVTPLSA
ncbi:hypothetical protein Tco_1220715 [Tanacetum coccineum]